MKAIKSFFSSTKKQDNDKHLNENNIVTKIKALDEDKAESIVDLDSDNLKKARAVKAEIKSKIINFNLLYPHQTKDPYHNPIARETLKLCKDKTLSQESIEFINTCFQSAKLIILDEHLKILHDYYQERSNQNDLLGTLYQTLSFDDFLLRLFNKRYQEVYLDGRAIVSRYPHDIYMHNNKRGGLQFFQNIGSAHDQEEFYQEYLTLEEMMLSPLVLAHAHSIVIGTGSRVPEMNWDIAREYDHSIDIASFSYPAAAEFRDGHTAHYDFICIAKPLAGYSRYHTHEITAIQNNQALLNAAHAIYGEKLMFEQLNDSSAEDILLICDNYLFNKIAYINRTKHILKQVLLTADYAMQQAELGKTFQLKGLGLGAFSFMSHAINCEIEKLYLTALNDVLLENKLQYITCINLINLPSTFNEKLSPYETENNDINGIKIIRTNMDPTINTETKHIGLIGGTVFCGDSASKVGNEGNIGLQRNSSDDPATQYSLLDPQILDPDINPILKTTVCIHVLTNQRKLTIWQDYPKDEFQKNAACKIYNTQ